MNSEYVDVVSNDGVRLYVRSRGSRERPAIVFLHGYMQCHLAWRKQFESSVADEFHLVAYDLRGHGWSDKPGDAESYRESRRWADDVAAVLTALEISRAVLVGWSYGGRVILDYIAAYGTASIAGINFVAAVIGDGAEYYSDKVGTIRETMDPDPMASIDGTRRFVRACFERQPDAGDFERILAYNAMVPPAIRAKLGRKVGAHHLLAKLDVPVLLTHGNKDGIIATAMSRYGEQTVPDGHLSLYDGIGHTPFVEDAQRFDRELAAFVRTCYAQSPGGRETS